MAVTREKLYEEVWAEPMTKVAPRYGVSSSFLARVCDRLNVPTPQRGYWAQLQVGKAPSRPPLPEARPGEELEWSQNGVPRRAPRAVPRPPEHGLRRRTRPRGERPTQHELLVGARGHFDAAKESDWGYLRPLKKLLVDVFVSKDALDRALETANAIFLAFEDRRHRVVFAPRDGYYGRPDVDERLKPGQARYFGSWRPARPTVVFIGTVAVGLTLFELSEEVEMEYRDGKYSRVSLLPASKRRVPPPAWTTKRDMPTGRLCLRASSPYPRAAWERQWCEAKPGDLVRQLPRIVRELEREAATIAKLVEEGERQAELERQRHEAELEQWRREEAERRRVQNLKASREQLISIIDGWAEAKRVEEFFEDAERRSAVLPEADRGGFLERLSRARSLLGGVDAVQRFQSWKAPDER